MKTANDFPRLEYNTKYAYALNPGWYCNNWTTQDIIRLGQKIGCHSWRTQLYESFFAQWGEDNLIPDYDFLTSIGAIDTTVMVGGPADINKDNPFNVQPEGPWDVPAGRIFKGMYLPIWSSPGVVNPENKYAVFLKKVIDKYGKYIKTYEVGNEPDFTKLIQTGTMDAEIEWSIRDPYPSELFNFRADIQYYIRMLRISWEVIKTFQPTAFVATGGIGINAFLDKILKYTDNPDAGKVTAEFPLTGGSYFDVLSFHTYPEFQYDVKHWTNDDGGHMIYNRHSDAFVAGHFRKKNDLNALLIKYGYDGVKYPAKHAICTETGASRVMDNDNMGSNEIQKNYQIKCRVKDIADGQIKQNFWYQSADSTPESSNDHWSLFGCYKYLCDKVPPNATVADQGKAMSTMSKLLFGKTYDKVKTAALSLPSTIDGAAFNDGTLCLWAKTNKDLSEVAMVPYTLSGSYSLITWDDIKTTISGTINLTGTPVFLVPTTVTPEPTPTKTLVKKSYWVVEGKYLYYKVYKIGIEKFSVETSRDYNWYKQA